MTLRGRDAYGDRQDVDARIGCELPRELQDPRATVRGDGPSARHELGGDDEVPGLPESFTERRRSGGLHASPSTSGVPYVWKLSIVWTPQNWPRARSCPVHTIGSKSGS